MPEDLVELDSISASITLGNGEVLYTVKDATLRMRRGISYAIVGKSGSGKTSLVSIIGLLNRKYSGTYLLDGVDVSALNDRARSKLRSRKLGFVFQNYSLIQHLTVRENIELAMHYSSKTKRFAKSCDPALDVLEMVGLADRHKEFPNRLSGGEQQRVAIARALVVEPELLICDEPTGALDTETSTSIMDLLLRLVKERSISLALVTHDPDIAALCDVSFRMNNGEIFHVQDAS